jgi:hypothetical protein
MITSLGIQDLLIGGISTVMGLFVLAIALGNWDWFYQLRLARRIELAYGRPGARLYYAGLSLLLVALGLAIAMGLIPHR